MNWAVVSSVLGGINLVVLVKLAFQYGRLWQKVEDIDTKGCSHRNNGCKPKA